MIPVADPFMAGVRPTGLQRGRGGFWRSADDAPYVTDPSGEVCKTGDRKGEVKRLKYGSPSNRGREIENDAGLVKYKQRLSLVGIGMSDDLARACKSLVDLPVGSPEFNSAADRIAVEADKLTRSSLAADRGTHGHLICQRVDEESDISFGDIHQDGERLGLDQKTQLATADAWAIMLNDNGLEILAIEASCVDDTWRLAGTLDRIVRLTRDLTFVKPGGELVTIPADTVLILDIKFGKCRKAHPIQIASYAQSVPYDTETEVRGVWPYQIDQTHGLIAHGDFGDDTRPVSIELVWVDLVAGREHGGQCVVDAKAWAARDDVFSVAQIVEGAPLTKALRAANRGIGQIVEGDGVAPDPGQGSAPSPSTLSPDDCNPHGIPRSSAGATVQTAPPTAGEDEATPSAPSPAMTPHDVFVKHGTAGPLADPDRLALVDARNQLATDPDQGADLTDDEFAPLWSQMRVQFDALDPAARSWRGGLVSEAQRRNVPFHVQQVRTERTYHLNKAIIALCAAEGDNDELLRALLALVVGQVALFPSLGCGHIVGSLNATEAATFATLVDQFHQGQMISVVDDDGTLRLIAA